MHKINLTGSQFPNAGQHAVAIASLRIAVTDGLQEGHALPLLFLAELVDVAFLPVPLPVFRLG
jgi:hypothetical protein